jgi:MoaA/NifB/PqqE/SkfB family radical SAM enzyme
MSNMVQFAVHFGQYLLRRNLQHLIVHVTNHCNFRCQHCFIDFSPKRDLKLEQYRKLGAEVGPLFWLDIGGGEPFLRKDLADIVGCFRCKVVQIPSNGSLPDQMIEQLERMRTTTSAEVAVSLSLDGLKDTHERLRGQPGSWDQVWSTFERLRSTGVPVKINTVLTKENAGEMIELMRLVRAQGPDFHSVILLRGDPMNPTMGLPPMDELRRLGTEMFAILETYDYGKGGASAGILRNYHRYMWDISLKTLTENRQIIPCLAGKAHMVVYGDGTVSSCEMLDVIGDIKTQSWSEIVKSQAFRDQRRSIGDGKCACTHNCAMLDSILLNPFTLPHLLKPRA